MKEFKYIFLNDIEFMKKKCFKVYIIYVILLLLSLITFKYMKYEMNSNLILSVFGLDFSITNNPLDVIMYGLSIAFSLYIFFMIFTNDILNNPEYIFLRIKAKKWILIKLCSIIIIYIFLKTIIYILIYLAILTLNIKIPISNIINYFTNDCLYFILVGMIFISLYISNWLIKLLIIICLFMSSCFFKTFNVIFFNNYKVILLMIIILIVFSITITFKKIYIKLFEIKGGKD